MNEKDLKPLHVPAGYCDYALGFICNCYRQSKRFYDMYAERVNALTERLKCPDSYPSKEEIKFERALKKLYLSKMNESKESMEDDLEVLRINNWEDKKDEPCYLWVIEDGDS